MAKRMTKQETIKKAQGHIERKSALAYEVANEHGQIFGNVRHMKWFLLAIANEIAPEALVTNAQ